MIKKLKTKGYYNPYPILEKKPTYAMVVGERSNGKTFAFLHEVAREYATTGRPSVYIRRLAESIKPKFLSSIFNSHWEKGLFDDLGCDCFVYRGNKWYFAWYTDETQTKKKLAKEPFMYCMALNQTEVSKSSLGDMNVKYVIFEEFMTRDVYLKNEFVLFMNMIATSLRETSDAIIIMIGNTVSWSAPYFREMGISHIKEQKQGTIAEYKYGTDTVVLVEYCGSIEKRKKEKTNKYFAFDNPQLNMITKGNWEIASYNHPNWRVGDSDLITRDLYIVIENEIIQVEIRKDGSHGVYALCHFANRVSEKARRVYTLHNNGDYRVHTQLINDKLDRLIKELYLTDKFFYDDNTTGENVRIWWKEMKTALIKK